MNYSDNDNNFAKQMQSLINMIEQTEFHDMEVEYIAQINKMEKDLTNMTSDSISDYIDSLDSVISDLKTKIIKQFSIHNEHLTDEYMDELIRTDRILFAKLNGTTKSCDCLQYLMAKDHYALELKDMLLSIPAVFSLSVISQNKLWTKGVQIAELNFLLNQPWSVLSLKSL